jgi:hypothetical protein
MPVIEEKALRGPSVPQQSLLWTTLPLYSLYASISANNIDYFSFNGNEIAGAPIQSSGRNAANLDGTNKGVEEMDFARSTP